MKSVLAVAVLFVFGCHADDDDDKPQRRPLFPGEALLAARQVSVSSVTINGRRFCVESSGPIVTRSRVTVHGDGTVSAAVDVSRLPE